MLIFQARSTRHLSLFGIRCNIGTDGIFFPTMFSLAFKATWAYVAVGAAIYLFQHPDCNTLSLPFILSVSIIGYIVLLLSGIINDMVVMVMSLLGSLRNFSPRRNIDIFIYIGCAFFLIQTGWDIFSTYTIFSPPVVAEQLTNCSSYSTALKIYQGVILSHWGLLLFLLLMYLILMDPLGYCFLPSRIKDLSEDLDNLEDPNGDHVAALTRLGIHGNSIGCIDWLLRCLCRRKRGISTGGKKALGDFVNTFNVLFEDMDYTHLDILSGLKLTALYQKKMREENKDPADFIIKKTVDVLKTDEDYVVPGDPQLVDNNELQKHIVDLKYYLDYAMAAYGWPIHIYLNPCTGPLSLCASTKGNCCCARCQEPYFEGNECSPNEAAIKAMTGVEDEDIITASFVNAVHIVPFYVVKDERDGQRQVIIAIRGTLSIKDALTDVSTSLCELEEDMLGVHPSYVHRGFYRAALGVYEHIMENEEFKDLVIKKSYRVVLTGHSLGAAVSSVLAVLFKHRHPEWTENLRAFNFATPAVFNYALARRTDEFIISVVSGYDVVPRATVRGLGHLVLSVADMIENSKHTKQSVLCCMGRCGWEPDINTDAVEVRLEAAFQELKLPLTESEEDVDGTDQSALTNDVSGKRETRPQPELVKRVLNQLTKLALNNEVVSIAEGKEGERGPMTFTPGRILHLEVVTVNAMKKCLSCGFKGMREVKASWKAREELSGIQVHESMFLDHGPTRTIDFIHILHNQLEESK